MSASENKRIVQEAFAELAKGNTRPFVALLADDVTWTVIGTTRWSRKYVGKKAVLGELLGPLFERFADTYTNTASLILADGDHVVIECQGRVMTKSGKPYNNTYCYVCRMDGGKIRALTDYLDTELVTAAIGD